MTLQSIRAVIEQPLITAFNDAGLPLYLNNMTVANTDVIKEYADLYLSFDQFTESALQINYERVTGVIVLGIFTELNKGPARSQDLSMIGIKALNDINSCGGKPKTGAYATLRNFSGPTFSELTDMPYYYARIEANFHAAYN